MQSHCLTTSRSNPQFYTFSQVFDRQAASLDPLWKEELQQSAWLSFWKREGHEYLEEKWHRRHPEYKETIESATDEERAAWQELWEKHVQDQNAHFWHIFSCVLENYERDLHNGFQDVGQILNDIDDQFSYLEIYQTDASTASTEYSEVDQENLHNNDDQESLGEEQQLKLLGLPTSFGAKSTNDRRKPKQQLPSESESESDSNHLSMSNEKDENQLDAKSRAIKKTKRKTNSKIPHFMRDDNLLLKYWFKRFSLFSRFDQGILLDRESWFSVTPEKIAKQTARRLASDVIVDAFCGCGGNAIQFANTCGRVIAIDIDLNKLTMAKQNAAIYGVAHKIDFVHADFLQFARTTRVRPDAIFLSPPWGGPGYQKQQTFDIEENLLPLGASPLMEHARRLTENIGFFLPRSSNIKQVIALTHAGEQCEVEHNYLDTRLVAITAYYGKSLIKKQRQKVDK
ncbi:trimethylguanosine synthase [Drosophila navojoa]|uniref:trimethylguanosine synthase n=1 Tax=Drosophila navojoa TaxID=7232 RepID=UPI0008462E9B|nr:trimethylguanosine synthase [Drosophila navojoa]